MREDVTQYTIISNSDHNNGKQYSNSYHYSLNNRSITFYFLILLLLFIVSYVIYLCDYYQKSSHLRLNANYGPLVKLSPNEVNVNLWNTERDNNADDVNSNAIIDKSDKFDITGDDVMVFLHIQNTGGNVFARHIVEDLILDNPCNCNINRRKRCQCLRPNRSNSQWFFSRLTFGWKCGIHPDFNELMHCTDSIIDESEGDSVKRRYFYITLLRDPITRFISEYNHLTAAAISGKASRRWCGGKEVTESADCGFDSDVTIDKFVDCENNMAINRQTRMLSDLALVGCYNQSFMPKHEREVVMLSSAKNNLHKMAFFGLNEFPKISQYLFEETFDMMFLDGNTHSLHRNKRSLLDDFDTKTINKIKQINHLDLQLYDYAKQLMFNRFEKLKSKNPLLKDMAVSKVAKDNEGVVNWGDSEDELKT